MRKNTLKKLTLARETLVRLNAPELGLAEGGAWSDDSVCPGTGPSVRAIAIAAACALYRNGVGD